MDEKRTDFKNSMSKLRVRLGDYISGRAVEEAPDDTAAEVKRRLTAAAVGVLAGVAGFMFARSQLVMESQPFGLALLCASTANVPFIYAGLITAAMFGGGYAAPQFFSWSFAFMLRIAFGLWIRPRRRPRGERTAAKEETAAAQIPKFFGEGIILRLSAAIGAAALIGSYRIIAGGFLYYDILGAMVDLAATPLLCFIFSGAFDRKKRFTPLHEAGVLGLIFSGVFALRGINIFGFSLANAAALIVTLYISKFGGVLRGSVTGLVCGLACKAAYAPVYAVAGLAAGFCWEMGAAVAVAASAISGIAYGVFLDGFNSLRIFAPDLLGAAVVFTPLAQFGLLPKLMIFSNGTSVPDSAANAAMVAEGAQARTVSRLEAMSSAMKELSEVFYTLSDRLRRPGIYDLRQLCDATFDKYCRKCAFYSTCWEREHSSTADVITGLAKRLLHGGRLDATDVPRFLAERCETLDKALEELNMSHAELLENMFKRDKTAVFAMDYEAMAKLLEYAVDTNESEYELDAPLCKRLAAAARSVNLWANNIAAYGKRRKRIVAGGIDLGRVRASANEIQRAFEAVSGTKLTLPEFSLEEDYVSMHLTSERRFKTEHARAAETKDDEEDKINGDVVTVFENSEDYFYTLISDGMGSGREAAVTSRVAGIFLEKMLSAGNSKAVTLEMLNNFIRSKNMESFATVDLLEIDLLDGEASFIKSGAAPSYILRGSSLFKIASNTMPVGITREMNAEEIKFALEPEDVVVMVSDGVAQSFEDGIWLANLLAEEWDDGASLDEMADIILDNARQNNKRSDDMTVGIVRLLSI